MAWLRIDDRFTEHRKVIALKRRADRWTWLEVLGYCARHDSGHVPADIDEVLRYVTPALVERFVEVGLLDRNPDGSFEVHDWSVYNAQTLEQRVAAFLESEPDASANRVHRSVGGKRDLVMRLVATIREGKPISGSPGTTERDPIDTPAGSPGTGLPVPRARDARGRGPHPTPRSTPTSHRSALPDDDAKPENDTRPELELDRLKTSGWTKPQIADTLRHDDVDRALAWLEHAERQPGVRSPGALAWSGYTSNVWPPDDRREIAPGAQGTRSTTTMHEHVCPRCPPEAPSSFKTEQRLVEHLEHVHGEYPDEPAIDLRT